MTNEEECGILGSQKKKMSYHGGPSKHGRELRFYSTGNQWKAVSKGIHDLLGDHSGEECLSVVKGSKEMG